MGSVRQIISGVSDHHQPGCLSCWSSNMNTSPTPGLAGSSSSSCFWHFSVSSAPPPPTTTVSWFLTVVVISFLGTIFFSIYYLCLAEPLNKLAVNWLMVEFWFTGAATFFYFTAFVSILSAFVGEEDEDYQYWVNANIAAGVFGLINFVVYAAGTYLIYMDWKANPTGCSAPSPPPV